MKKKYLFSKWLQKLVPERRNDIFKEKGEFTLSSVGSNPPYCCVCLWQRSCGKSPTFCRAGELNGLIGLVALFNQTEGPSQPKTSEWKRKSQGSEGTFSSETRENLFSYFLDSCLACQISY